MKVAVFFNGQPSPEPLKQLEVRRDCGCIWSRSEWPGGIETSGIVMCPDHSAAAAKLMQRGKA